MLKGEAWRLEDGATRLEATWRLDGNVWRLDKGTWGLEGAKRRLEVETLRLAGLVGLEGLAGREELAGLEVRMGLAGLAGRISTLPELISKLEGKAW